MELVLPPGPVFMYCKFMAKSINATHKKKGRGRPATGPNPTFAFRISPQLLRDVDDWGADQRPALGRSEALRELIRAGLERQFTKRR